MEASYESLLRGVPGRRQFEVNAEGRELRTLSGEDPVPGRSVVLTLDLELQRQVREILLESMGGSLFASAVVVNVPHGRIACDGLRADL